LIPDKNCDNYYHNHIDYRVGNGYYRTIIRYICAAAFVIVDKFRASIPVGSIAAIIETITIFLLLLLLLLITLFNANLIYLWLEGTLYNVGILHD
jgi:hypothetical protein